METLPFIQALRLRILHLVPDRKMTYPVGVLDVVYSANKSHTIQNFVKVRAEATIYYEQDVKEGEMEGVKKHAVQALALQMYGPIETELREIRELMWSGQLVGSDIEKRVGHLIDVLRAEG